MGVAGTIGILDVIESKFSGVIQDCKTKKEIVTYLVPILREEFADTSYMHDRYLEGQILIAYENRIYIIESNFDVFEREEYGAIGSGKDCACSSLYSTSITKMSQKDRLKIAIESTGKILLSVSTDVYIADTLNGQFERY